MSIVRQVTIRLNNTRFKLRLKMDFELGIIFAHQGSHQYTAKLTYYLLMNRYIRKR